MSLQAFKTGFLEECKQAGLNDREIHHCLDLALDMAEKKAAADGNSLAALTGAVTNPIKSMWGGVKSVAPWAAAAYLAPPIAAGVVGGTALSHMQQLDENDLEDLRTQEKIDTYRQIAREMAVKSKTRQQIPSRARSPIIR